MVWLGRCGWSGEALWKLGAEHSVERDVYTLCGSVFSKIEALRGCCEAEA
jgi:hypothetical protein